MKTLLATKKKAPADALAPFDQAITTIEASTDTPTLVDLKDFKSRPKAGQ